MPEYQNVIYERLGRVARITANRPRYRNAQSTPLLRELDRAFGDAVDDPNVRVIIMAGAGESFSAGHDLGTPEHVEYQRAHPRQGRSEVEKSFSYSWQHYLDMSLRWRDIPKPTIAQVQGWCIFGGWLIASAMDLICASQDARFLTNLLQFTSLPYDVGVRKAKEILFDNRALTAEEAADLGFVNHVFAKDELAEKTLELADRIAGNASFYLRLAKLTVNQMQDAAGFKVATQAAHSNYHLSQIHNTLRGAETQDRPPADRTGGRGLDVAKRMVAKAREEGLDPKDA
jgi:enoyl-CoA hydratase